MKIVVTLAKHDLAWFSARIAANGEPVGQIDNRVNKVADFLLRVDARLQHDGVAVNNAHFQRKGE